MEMLELENIRYIYPDGTMALEDVSFQIRKGARTFIHGLNGAGKTTLFQCMNGLLKPDQGEIRIDGKACRDKELMRRVGIVFQNADDQMIAGSVYEELSFGLMNMGLPEEEVRCRVEKAIEDFQLETMRDKPPHFLSFGQKKRVSIASISAMAPEVIIFDEPTANLDHEQTERVIRIFHDLAEKGIAVVVATHDIDMSWRCADYIIGLSDGKVFMEGIPEKIFANPLFLDTMNISKPLVLEIFECFSRGMKENGFPRNRQELLNFLKEREFQL